MLRDLTTKYSMYKRYVNDINIDFRASPLGMRYRCKQLYVDENSITDQTICDVQTNEQCY